MSNPFVGSYSPARQFRSDFNTSVPDTLFSFCGEACAHYRIDNCTRCSVADSAACGEVRVCASCQVEGIAIVDGILANHIGGEGGQQVQVVVPNEGIVRRHSCHLELAISRKRTNVSIF